MAFVKYSIGTITEVKDNGVVVKKNEDNQVNNDYKIAMCEKCGLQHMLVKDAGAVFCCDKEIKVN